MPRRRSRLHSVAEQGWKSRVADPSAGGETRRVNRTRFGDLHIRTVVRAEIKLPLSCPRERVCAFNREFDISGVACATQRRRINPDFSHFVCFSEKYANSYGCWKENGDKIQSM